jgi:divalent metal cation (Fe/Co/Zn/Cd) transporter
VADGTREGLLIQARHQEVSRVLLRVLLFNLLVAAAKLALGYATGAVSVVSDGFHSLTDSASNIIGLVGLRASRKPPDSDHPYGHRKFETLAAGGIFMFLMLAVLEIGRTALHRFGSTEPPQVTWLSFAIMIATLGVNLAVVRYESGAGRRLNSELLMADSVHTRSDVFATIGVLFSLAAVAAGYPILDPIGGVVIAVLIARTSTRSRATRPGFCPTAPSSTRTTSGRPRWPSRACSAAITSGRAARWITSSSTRTSGSPPTRPSATRTACRTS